MRSIDARCQSYELVWPVKICFSCQVARPSKEFSINKRRASLLDDDCRLCRKTKRKSRPRVVDLLRIAQQRFITDYKSKVGCACGEKDPVALELHHRDRALKVASICQLTTYPELLRIELIKCDVICANCHRKAHREMQSRHLSPLLDDLLAKYLAGGQRLVPLPAGLPVDKLRKKRKQRAIGWTWGSGLKKLRSKTK